MGQPVFYLLAGPNGAGKSTLHRALVLAGTIPAEAEFVNADLLYGSVDVSPGTHTAVAICKGDWTQALVQPIPAWARQVLWHE